MVKKISIVITTRNEQAVIGDLLNSIKRQTYPGWEIVVVDNNSDDATKKIVSKYTKQVYNFGPERSSQRNFGVKKATGQFVLILDADMQLEPKVLADCLAVMADERVGAVIIPERSFGIGFWARCKAFEREFYVGDEAIEAARFFRKELFNKFGGYDESITGPEDADLPLRMRKKGVKIGRIDSFILHNEKRFSPLKSARKKFYYAQHARQYLKRHPEMILTQGNLFFRPSFFRQTPRMLMHPVLAIGMFWVRFLEMGGALLGISLAVTIRRGQR